MYDLGLGSVPDFGGGGDFDYGGDFGDSADAGWPGGLADVAFGEIIEAPADAKPAEASINSLLDLPLPDVMPPQEGQSGAATAPATPAAAGQSLLSRIEGFSVAYQSDGIGLPAAAPASFLGRDMQVGDLLGETTVAASAGLPEWAIALPYLDPNVYGEPGDPTGGSMRIEGAPIAMLSEASDKRAVTYPTPWRRTWSTMGEIETRDIGPHDWEERPVQSPTEVTLPPVTIRMPREAAAGTMESAPTASDLLNRDRTVVVTVVPTLDSLNVDPSSALGNSFVDETNSERNPSHANYRNEMDRESDAYEPGFGITSAQRRALNEGAGPLNAEAAQAWEAAADEPIGPAANGRLLASKAQEAASAAARARTAKIAFDLWSGTGEFAATTADSRSLSSALKDTGRVLWNLGVDALALIEIGNPALGSQRIGFRTVDVNLPSVADWRAPYDTPVFGMTAEVLAPLVPITRLLGVPRSIGGAAFVDGKFVHDLKPLSNLELYGTAATRTPDEAVQLLQRVGHDPEVLAQYRIVKLSDTEYSALTRDLGFEFDATYGRVPPRAPSVTFSDNIASKMADGTSKIPVYVRREVFDSDEALVQILSHEIHETQELKFVASRPISTTEYKNLVKPNGPGNLHWQAVQEGDWWLQRFRDMLPGKP